MINKKETELKIEIMKAYINGKIIMSRRKYSPEIYKVVDEPGWNFVEMSYKVADSEKDGRVCIKCKNYVGCEVIEATQNHKQTTLDEGFLSSFGCNFYEN